MHASLVNSQYLQVLNAAMLYWPMSNVLYVEGYALDRFAEGLWALQPVHQNRVCFENLEFAFVSSTKDYIIVTCYYVIVYKTCYVNL